MPDATVNRMFKISIGDDADLDVLAARDAAASGARTSRSATVRRLIREAAGAMKVKRTRAPRGKGA